MWPPQTADMGRLDVVGVLLQRHGLFLPNLRRDLEGVLMPLRLKIGIHSCINDEQAWSAFCSPGLDRRQVRRCAGFDCGCTKTLRNCGEVHVWKFYDVSSVAAAPEIVNFCAISEVIVNHNAHPQAEPSSCLKLS
jgi:hypothetical protein